MPKFFEHNDDVYNFNAPREIVPLIIQVINPKSVLDIGCGIGTWLKIFEENGVVDYLGVDSEFVELQHLKIPHNHFVGHDLRKELSLNRKFDLVVSLEVAEHLPESSADLFVKTLVSHGEAILFSAAIPGQGGQDHLNEQWPDYWKKKFSFHGYYFHDVLRPVIWGNENVDWWYRQNIFLLSKESPPMDVLPLVHPLCFRRQQQLHHSMTMSIMSGRNGVIEAFKIFLRSLRVKLLG